VRERAAASRRMKAMTDRRHTTALLRAHEDANELALRSPERKARAFNVAIGDPQASLSQFLRVLDLHGLLDDDGRIRPEVGLVSMGDHFDFGRPEQRAEATNDGLCILSWLAAHPPDQVQIIVGNHDLVRVGELASFTDESYAEAQALADQALQNPSKVAAFTARYPMLASPAVIARDYSCFSVRQRELVARLLKRKRLRLAVAAANDLLLVHAGITADDLGLLESLPAWDAPTIAAALNQFLDDRVARWKGEGPLDLAPLHELGSARDGEAKGILAHRPANPAVRKPDRAQRTYDPNSLPRNLVQIIGHINDKKCRELMGDWAEKKAPEPGVLRGLKIGYQVSYHTGCDDDDRLVFLDGGMNQVAPFEYEIYDLELRQRMIRKSG